ncbi:MAG: inositol-3-phosphate synthase [Candidatus Cloacimonadota bacterium]|nr:inositol-3-phosphate synthase [Candidatus Cloacimonadota bacterium]
MEIKIEKPSKKLGVLIPGLGAIGTTFIAGIELIKKGYSKPIGSLTQMGTIRLGKRTEDRTPLVKDFVPIHKIEDLVVGGWDIFEDTAYESAINAQVLSNEHIELAKEKLQSVKPMKAVFDKKYVKNLDGPNVKKAANKFELAQQLMDDIDNFKKENDLTDVVMIWCASTEIYIEQQPVHETLEAFEKGMKENHDAIAPSMIYAYASLKKGIPFAMGAPNLTVDIPAIWELAKENKLPIAGKDFKTGQTLMKTILAPGLKARLLGINGWFSTNILGNRDGEVLDDPDSFKTKEVSKLSVLDSILQPEKNPDLYKNLYHKVRINYYPPRGDDKEGWDNIDIFGWLGYNMQIKIDFLCKDSILAAPIVLDLILFMDLARRAGLGGIQEWLSFYFKSPMHLPELYPEHDLFVQLAKLKNTLRYMMGEEMITHLGLDYYYDDV